MHMMRGIMMVQILICLLKISHNAKTETTIYLVACRITMKIHVRTPSSSCHGEGHGVPSGLAHSENLCFFTFLVLPFLCQSLEASPAPKVIILLS